MNTRQTEVARRFAAGESAKAIAAEFGISPNSVHVYASRVRNSAHRPASDSGSAVSSSGNGASSCLASEDLPARVAGVCGSFIHDDAIRELIAAGMTRREAARKLDLTQSFVRRAMRRMNIQSSLEAQKRAMREGAKLGGWSVACRAKAAPPNPFRTAAQQANVDDIKRRTWFSRNPVLMALPKPDPDEAARLVAEFIASRGVTVCPGPVIDEPSNFGCKFR